jgi:DNA repair exonuclease SbcCD ATPase subunit
MIFFTKIRWKNFLSTGNAYTEIDLSKSNTTLIVGENGSGKSTFLDALTFALYGKPFRKINKPQLLNSINKKDLVAELEFMIGKNQYKIIRGLKPSVFEVYQNGKMINQNAESKDYQEVLEKQILKLNHKSFCQVVVLGSASFVPFMQLSAAARREIIEDILDIQIFSTMNSLLKERVSTNTSSLNKVDYEYELTSEKIRMQNEHIAIMQKNNAELVDKYKNEHESYRLRIYEEKTTIDKVDEQISKLNDSILDHEKVDSKARKLSILETQLETKITKLQEDIEFFHNHDTCPTCRQDIDETFKCDTITTKNSSMEETLSGIAQLRSEINNIRDRLKNIATIKSQITDLNIEAVRHSNNITGLREQCDKLSAKITELLDKTKEYVNNDDKMKELEAKLGALTVDKTEILKDRDALGVTSIILRDNGIKSLLIKKYVPVINKLINKYLAAMDFFVNFELDENFNETIKSRFRDEFSYASFSEGEKMRINLAILFTWRAVAKLRNSASTNLLIMDEVMDGSLDSNGTDEFLKIILNLTHDTNTFIISHKTDQLYDKFTNVLKFEKHKNFSRIAA